MIAVLSRCKMTGEVEEKQTPASLPEMRIMLKIISGIGWTNLLIGLPSLLLTLGAPNSSLTATGVLSVLTFVLLRMTLRHIRQSKSWVEIGIAAMSGVYFPAFIMWVSAINLIDTVVR